MTLDVRINGRCIRRVKIVNTTELPTGINDYHWVCTDPNGHKRLTGNVRHNYEDSAMALISTVAQAISQAEADDN